MRQLLSFASLIVALSVQAQGVGINNPTPDNSALLDLTSTNKGLLLPRMTTAQRNAIPVPATSLVIYNTSTTRFEYFDGAAWVPFVGGNSLDAAYDLGGPGLGRVIQADNGPVRINGNAGLMVTGATLGTGPAVEVTGPGIRMFFNPNKAAFRAGSVGGTQWNDVNVGQYSFATNLNAIASGTYSSAFGFNSVAFGEASFATGNGTQAIGSRSTAIGHQNTARTYGELVLGIGATNYTPSATGATEFTAANATDRLLVVGNATDVNSNGVVDFAERRDALVILKNGNTGIGSSTPQDRLHVVGNIRMVDGNQAANRVLTSDATGRGSWQVPKQPNHYVSVGTFGTFIGSTMNLLSQMSITFVPNHPIAIVHFSGGTPNGTVNCNTALEFQLVVNGSVVMSHPTGITGESGTFGTDIYGYDAAFTYPISVTPGVSTTVQIRARSSNCSVPNAIGRSLVVIDPNGTGLTTTTGTPPSTGSWDLTGNFTTNPTVNFVGTRDNQALAFRTFNTERMRISNTGNVGIGTNNPIERFHLAGRSLFENGFSVDNAALLYRNNTHYMFIGPQSGSSANGGAIALYGSANSTGTNPNGIDLNAPGGNIRLNHTGGNFEFRSTSTSGYTATMELNDVGFQIGHNSTGRDINFVNGNGERLRITPTGNNLTAGGSWGVLSDRRVKSDIRTIEYGLSEVLAMRPVRYFHHDSKGFDHTPGEQTSAGKQDIGFIAQDLYAVVPEVVVKPADEEANLWAVTYERLVPVLVKAVQEQQAQIDALRLELEALKNQR